MPVLRRSAGGLAAVALLCACAAVRLPPALDPAQRQSGGMAADEFPAQVRIDRPGMTCRGATAAARTAIRKLGYAVDSVLPPAPGETGEIRARRHSGWRTGSPGDAYGVAVRMTCDDNGAAIAAATEEPLRARLAFQRDFPTEFARASLPRVAPPHSATRHPPARLRVGIEPLGGSAAAERLGGSPEATGLTPVRIAISNHTETHYRITVHSIQLVSEEGREVRPLAIDELATRLSAEAFDRVTREVLRDTDLPPGVDVVGYVYVPAAAYRRAKLQLVESDSGEAEGFSVEY